MELYTLLFMAGIAIGMFVEKRYGAAVSLKVGELEVKATKVEDVVRVLEHNLVAKATSAPKLIEKI